MADPLLKMCASTLTFESLGECGIHFWCWVRIIDFNHSEIYTYVFKTLIDWPKCLECKWLNEKGKFNSSRFFTFSFLNSRSLVLNTLTVNSNATLRLREHICRANCLFECGLWVHYQVQFRIFFFNVFFLHIFKHIFKERQCREVQFKPEVYMHYIKRHITFLYIVPIHFFSQCLRWNQIKLSLFLSFKIIEIICIS